jgi:hypothetical protein
MRLLLIVLLMSTTCFAQEFEGGFIKVKSTGGTAPFTYSIDNGAYQIKDTFFNVQPGVHTINTKDAKNCVKTSVCTMYNKLSMDVLRYTTSTVTFKVNGGKPPYFFSKNSTTNWVLNKKYWTGLRQNRLYTFRVKDQLVYQYYITVTL